MVYDVLHVVYNNHSLSLSKKKKKEKNNHSLLKALTLGYLYLLNKNEYFNFIIFEQRVIKIFIRHKINKFKK